MFLIFVIEMTHNFVFLIIEANLFEACHFEILHSRQEKLLLPIYLSLSLGASEGPTRSDGMDGVEVPVLIQSSVHWHYPHIFKLDIFLKNIIHEHHPGSKIRD